jgi:hypothetical protein
MTQERYVGQIWRMYGLTALLVLLWVLPMAGGDFFGLPIGLFMAVWTGGGSLLAGLGASLYLTLLSRLPSYRWYLAAMGATVLVFAVFLFAGLSWDDALEFTLMLMYGLMPFAIAGGFIYGVKVRRWLLWSLPALIPPAVFYQVLVQRQVVTHWWPVLLIGDLAVLAWFYVITDDSRTGPASAWRRYVFTDPTHLVVLDPAARTVEWQGRPALRLEGGFALLRDLTVEDALVEIDLGVDPGGAYPGLAFRGRSREEIELLYCQPHTSGQWDALQYDPVFHGSNTWQIFHGPGCQAAATVDAGHWITLQVELRGHTATARILGDDAPPLVVPALAHGNLSGRIGVWTFRPAHFAEMRVRPLERSAAPAAEAPQIPPEWELQGHGPVSAEPNGIINLNRYLPVSDQPAVLRREFEVGPEGEAELRFGFSDELRLLVDGEEVFSGTNRFTGFTDRQSRGYIEPEAHRVALKLQPGRHTLTAELAAREPFGWGLALRLEQRYGRD